MYRNTRTGAPLTLSRDKDGIRAQRYGPLVAMSGTRAVTASGTTWEFDGRGGAQMTDPFRTVDKFERVPPAKPAVADLKTLAGVYASDEAEATLTVDVEGDSLVVKRRPDTTLKLTPVYADAFSAPQLGFVIFRRNAGGRVTELSVVQDRVWDLRFARQTAALKSVSQ